MKHLLIVVAFLYLLAFTGIYFGLKTRKPAPDAFDKPYKVSVIDDHEVQLTYKADTVRLYLENAYLLSEEAVIFIKK